MGTCGPPSYFWPTYCPEAKTGGSGIISTCCTEPNPLVGASLSQCCGTLKSLKVCLSTSSTIGVVGGYLSLWYSIVQSLYTGFAMLYIYRLKAKESKGTAMPQDQIWSEKNGDVELVKEDTQMIPGAPIPDAPSV